MCTSRRRCDLLFRSAPLLGLFVAVSLVLASTGSAQPVFDGVEATVYATADNPFELEFGPDGTLYAGHHSPPNGPARLLRVLVGSGAATEWGAQTPEDPDGIDYFSGLVYAASEGPIWQANPATGAMAVWATVPGSPNQSTLVVDEAGDYAQAGSIFVGNARFA